MKYKILPLLIFIVSADASDRVESEYPYVPQNTIETSRQTYDRSQNQYQYIQPIFAAIKEDGVFKRITLDGESDLSVGDKNQKTKKLVAVEISQDSALSDSDNDGVVDSKDTCPDTSKEFAVDSNGCPITATLKVIFEHGRFQISVETKSAIKEFAEFLKENKKYDVIIYGYTDNTNRSLDKNKNKILSQNRAIAIKEALSDYGISGTRLTAIGRGEENPIADNATEEGRAKNRRIEVELMQ
jgi:OmpA-OmpF porin, OOP family